MPAEPPISLASAVSEVFGLGVDGAGRHGWVGVVVGAEGFAGVHVAATVDAVVAAAESSLGTALAAVGVDIPIGLVAAARRSADVAARSYIGARRASLFWTPHRAALDARDQADANRRLAALGMPKVSAQGWNLMPRIREVAALARADRRVVEVFPEASFRALAGADLPYAKRTSAGALHRLALLEEADPPVVLPRRPEALGEAGAVPLDDLLDAAGAGWTAHRVGLGAAFALGDPEERDVDCGQPIAVWV